MRDYEIGEFAHMLDCEAIDLPTKVITAHDTLQRLRKRLRGTRQDVTRDDYPMIAMLALGVNAKLKPAGGKKE